MTKHALIVDDDAAMVKTLSDVLRLKGWHVSAAYSGGAAVEAVEQTDFDVVVMDIRMPGMDGVDAFKAMKRRDPDIPVVLMTAFAAPDRVGEAERHGVIRVLHKPVDVGALLQLLAERLSMQRPVLIIDEDAAFIKTMSEVLRLRGFEVVVTDQPARAASLCGERRPMAVLLHMHVGRASAPHSVRAVHEACPEAALILYSGQSGGEVVAHDVPADWVHSFLQKPFAVDQVTGVLDEIRRGS